MQKEPQKVNSYRSDCDQCGAEWVTTVFYAPPFKDMVQHCPFCGHIIKDELEAA